VLAIKDAASSITAVERMAVVTQTFATSIVTSEPPRNGAKAYCDAMTVAAEPLEARTIEAFGVCLAKSTELGWFGESSVRCERELSRLKPDLYPRLAEMRSSATYVAPVLTAEPPIR
jgi:hypothetical protein